MTELLRARGLHFFGVEGIPDTENGIFQFSRGRKGDDPKGRVQVQGQEIPDPIRSWGLRGAVLIDKARHRRLYKSPLVMGPTEDASMALASYWSFLTGEVLFPLAVSCP